MTCQHLQGRGNAVGFRWPVDPPAYNYSYAVEYKADSHTAELITVSLAYPSLVPNNNNNNNRYHYLTIITVGTSATVTKEFGT